MAALAIIMGVIAGLAAGFVAAFFLAWRPPETLFYVGKRRPAAELLPDQIEQIRQAYKDTGWASDFSVEAVGIYLTEKEAIAASNFDGGYYHELPVGRSLPDKQLRFRTHRFPWSNRQDIYQHVRAPFVTLEADKVRHVRSELAEVQQSLVEAQAILRV